MRFTVEKKRERHGGGRQREGGKKAAASHSRALAIDHSRRKNEGGRKGGGATSDRPIVYHQGGVDLGQKKMAFESTKNIVVRWGRAKQRQLSASLTRKPSEKGGKTLGEKEKEGD